MTKTQNKTIQVVIGPTASGKSSYALGLSEKHDGIVINCDAMQSYDALHILTAQPNEEEKGSIPHKLYGHLHPSTHYSAADWRQDAITEIENAFNLGKTPIICGGTGFYLKALMDGLSPMPETPKEIREMATSLQKEMGQEEFYSALKEKDPQTAAQIDPQNPRRSIRAWEVLDHTGIPLSQWQEKPPIGPPDDWNFIVTALLPNRSNLISNINNRLAIMLDHGVLNEVKTLDNMINEGKVPLDALIIKAHGFRPFRRYLNNDWTMDQAIEWTQTETRQYAKRQMTWIRNQLKIDHVVGEL